MDMNLSKLWEIVENRGAWHAAVHGIPQSRIWPTDSTITRPNLCSWPVSCGPGRQECSVTLSCPTFCGPMDYSIPAFLSYTISWSWLKFLSIESMMLSNHLILCCLLLLPSSFPTTGSWPMSWLFASGDQSIGASASAFTLPLNIQGQFPLILTGLIFLWKVLRK